MSARPATRAPDAQALRFAGYAAVFGQRDSGGDTILPGAFAGTLAARKAAGMPLPLYWQHRPDQQIGWVDMAEEDTHGLRVIATLDEPQGPAARALARGSVNGLSFGYRVREGRRHAAGRDLAAIDLLEVSLVTRPMQPLARVHLIDRAAPRAASPT